jgi:hypothetical protein
VDPTTDDTFGEITILPDGRMYVFGLTDALLEVLAIVPTQGGVWQALREQIRPVPAAGGSGDEP